VDRAWVGLWLVQVRWTVWPPPVLQEFRDTISLSYCNLMIVCVNTVLNSLSYCNLMIVCINTVLNYLSYCNLMIVCVNTVLNYLSYCNLRLYV